MTAVECYKTYLALKRHFTSDYDYFKYNGKTSASSKSFEGRKDRIFFEKLAKHHDPVGMLVANLLVNPKAWIRDISYTESANRTYEDWVKRVQSMSYSLKRELKELDEDFDSNIIVKPGGHAKLVKLYLSGRVSLETITVIALVAGCIRYWDRNMNDPVWEEVGTKIKKYAPFMTRRCDMDRLKKLVVDFFRDSGINTTEAQPQ